MTEVFLTQCIYYAEAAKAQAKAVEHGEMAGWYRKAGEGVKKTPYAPATIIANGW